MYQAITTKYLGPTDTKGARIKATSASGHSKIVPYDHALNTADNHTAAARALAEKLEWSGTWVAGALEPGFVFVCMMRGASLQGSDGFVL